MTEIEQRMATMLFEMPSASLRVGKFDSDNPERLLWHCMYWLPPSMRSAVGDTPLEAIEKALQSYHHEIIVEG